MTVLSRPSDPLPAFGFPILNNADAIILTFEVHAKVIDDRGRAWQAWRA